MPSVTHRVARLLPPLALPLALVAQPARESPVSRTSFDGPALVLDWPALHIGVAEYDEGPTGATVFYFPERAVGAVDVRGGAPGTVNTDALRQGYESRVLHAVVFAGGSWNGLAAATGVADEIRASRARPDAPPPIPGVAAAIIFDLGGRRFSTVTPDDRLGRAALRAARPGRFPLGARGAGRFAMQGWTVGGGVHSGQGGAFRQVGATKVAVFTVVNALGAVVDREGRIVRCLRAAPPAGCGTIAGAFAERHARLAREAPAPGGGGAGDASADASADDAPDGRSAHTTLTLVVTNRRLAAWQLQRLAVQVHASMARAIQPFNTEEDGDVLYAVSTGEVRDSTLSVTDLGTIASEVAWDAVLSSVPALAPPGPTTPVALAVTAAEGLTGEYELGPGARVTVRRDGARLVVESARGAGIYVPRGRVPALVPVGAAEFLVEGPRGDRLRFERAADGRVTGLVINPGPWAVRGRRLP
jgi:6-aminohexanoate-oligomer endohydrolase